MKAFEAERVLRRMTALPDQVGGGVGGPVGGAPAVGQARGGRKERVLMRVTTLPDLVGGLRGGNEGLFKWPCRMAIGNWGRNGWIGFSSVCAGS